MMLYLDYSPLRSDAGSCAAAHAALRHAGPRLEVVYGVKALDALGAGHGRNLAPPVLVTDTGTIITSLPDILSWRRPDGEGEAEAAAGSARANGVGAGRRAAGGGRRAGGGGLDDQAR
jgi:hypothetical protein